MTRKAVSLLLILLTLVCLSGCWSRREMSELAIVMGAGVDRTPDNRIRLTLQLARPAAFAGGAETGGVGAAERQNITWVVSETGDTIFEAERNLALKISRRIYWAHNIILVFGAEAAQSGVGNYADFFMRDPMPRENTWVLVTRGEAKELLESHSELEKTSAQSIGFVERNKAGLAVMFKDFAMALASRGTNPALPEVELQKLGEPQGSGMEDKKQHEEVVITGTGVFKDEYLVGWLDTSETRGLLWLRGEINKGIITVPSPGQPDKLISINVARARTRVEPEYDGENISFDIIMDFEGELLEQQSRENLTTPDKAEEIEAAAAEEVIRRCTATLAKAQGEYGVDIFNFGEAFHRKYKQDWKELKYQWNDAFAKAQVNISVEAHLRRTGLLSKPASVRK
ncbi:Spore germination protein A3 precursor [Pelotomaculum sp. FP]|uniref:Ger(x)C family spore germination protein n=1 Tax=Pelotomaculum sp. FP TaxID=261474 RepID=UPI001065F29D|nr:Ger(x)C family spore germination protein [Pelotomaculum sp. FP]TEB14430.1 Spore germination protein A3 precursor [Pelotomaculum sp. FP]